MRISAVQAWQSSSEAPTNISHFSWKIFFSHLPIAPTGNVNILFFYRNINCIVSFSFLETYCKLVKILMIGIFKEFLLNRIVEKKVERQRRDHVAWSISSYSFFFIMKSIKKIFYVEFIERFRIWSLPFFVCYKVFVEKRKTWSGEDSRPDWHVGSDTFIDESQSLLVNIDCSEVEQYFLLGNLVELRKGNAGAEPFSFEMINDVLL